MASVIKSGKTSKETSLNLLTSKRHCHSFNTLGVFDLKKKIYSSLLDYLKHAPCLLWQSIPDIFAWRHLSKLLDTLRNICCGSILSPWFEFSYFALVSNSSSYITIPKNNRKIKLKSQHIHLVDDLSGQRRRCCFFSFKGSNALNFKAFRIFYFILPSNFITNLFFRTLPLSFPPIRASFLFN